MAAFIFSRHAVMSGAAMHTTWRILPPAKAVPDAEQVVVLFNIP
ncbi:hypothetical protein GGQ73_001611 [Rhizobium skierniewicense]|uniref:Uncharacterized protein n=1 Tax=Rhizobium skierniewicense TaxID=984260 RepID=A0A7W6CED7_9HYPH|nr:hypothetical protein [Rhizobium skierniewicense]